MIIMKVTIFLDHVMCFQAVDAKSIRVVITLGRQTSLWSLLADTDAPDEDEDEKRYIFEEK